MSYLSACCGVRMLRVLPGGTSSARRCCEAGFRVHLLELHHPPAGIPPVHPGKPLQAEASHLLRLGGRLHSLRSTDPHWHGDLHFNLQVGSGKQAAPKVLLPGANVPLPLRLQFHSGRTITITSTNTASRTRCPAEDTGAAGGARGRTRAEEAGGPCNSSSPCPPRSRCGISPTTTSRPSPGTPPVTRCRRQRTSTGSTPGNSRSRYSEERRPSEGFFFLAKNNLN
ncbi:hypothetical protein NPIL_563141 [Nephila pilipes]|uniref:Uncharacterized protein n=1 Tax=Nephila pilipes TaxID=299642 RepID=A0A8X6P583_NEPPI|nr:hypothetical protein NPIL_563141 [Nephila pilipes]